MTSPVDTSVNFYDEGMPGAPTLNGTAGSLLAAIRACLCTGFGSRACTITVSGGVATVTVASDVKNLNTPKTVQLIAGVTGGPTGFADLNGKQKIVSATATTLTFACPTVSNGAATGTITVKHAPLGATEVYTGTNKAVFRFDDPTGKRYYLRVDDTATTYASVRGYITMSDVDTGTDPFPPATTLDANTVWQKTGAGTATATGWNIHGDMACFYYSPMPNRYVSASYWGQTTYFFGDVSSYLSTDAYATGLISGPSAGHGWAAGNVFSTGPSHAGVFWWPRSYTGLGFPTILYTSPMSGAVGFHSGQDTGQADFPSLIDGSMRVTPILALETTTSNATNSRYRGELPGIRYVLHRGTVGASYPRGSTIAMAGRTYYAVNPGDWSASSAGLGLIDITGPWR